jgi:hypothetical protein
MIYTYNTDVMSLSFICHQHNAVFGLTSVSGCVLKVLLNEYNNLFKKCACEDL